MRAAAAAGFSTATDLADWLVRELGLPFREAHHVTGALVALAESGGVDLAELPLAELQAIEPRITAEVFAVLTVETSVASRTSYGGTAPAQVRAQVARWKAISDEPTVCTLRPGLRRLALMLALLASRCARRPRTALAATATADWRPAAQGGLNGRRTPPTRHRDPCPTAATRRQCDRSHEPFRIATACSTPRTCRSRRIADDGRHAVLLSIRPPRWSGTTGCFARRLRRPPELGEPLICYAMKANSNHRGASRTLARLGAGADVVSEGELPPRAGGRRAGPSGSSSPASARPRGEMRLRAREGIAQINVEVRARAGAARAQVAAASGAAAPHRHPRQPRRRRQRPTPRSPPARPRTSSASRSRERRAALRPGRRQLPGIEPVGRRLPHRQPDHRPAALSRRLPADARAWSSSCAATASRSSGSTSAAASASPIATEPDAADAGRLRGRWWPGTVGDLGLRDAFEPGRVIAGNAGVLLSRVIYVASAADGRHFLVLDAAMNDLIRPAMYDA